MGSPRNLPTHHQLPEKLFPNSIRQARGKDLIAKNKLIVNIFNERQTKKRICSSVKFAFC
jgi:hypothetical protein